MITPYQLLQESGFAQYTAMVRFHYNRDNTSLGAEKIAEMVRAIPGATRVSTVSLDKEHGIGIFNVKIISMKTPKEAYAALKKNALERYQGLITGVEVGANTIEVKGDFIIKESNTHLRQCLREILLEEGLLLEVSIEDLRKQYVESDPPKLTDEVFNRILQASENKSNFATWLCKKISDQLVPLEDLEGWHDAFQFFDKYKQRFQKKDINREIKTAEDIAAFKEELKKVKQDVEDKKTGVKTQNKGEEKLPPYQVGNLTTSDGEEWKVYKTKKGEYDLERKLGSGARWCTVSSLSMFNTYLTGPDDHYYIFINKNKPDTCKYQIHHATNQFADIHNQTPRDLGQPFVIEFYEYLKEKEGKEIPERIRQAQQKYIETKEKWDKIKDAVPVLDEVIKGQQLSTGAVVYKLPGDATLAALALRDAKISKGFSCYSLASNRFANQHQDFPYYILKPVNGKGDVLNMYHTYAGLFVRSYVDSEYGDTNLPNCTENNVEDYKEFARLNNARINDDVLTRCNKELPSLDSFKWRESDTRKGYKVPVRDFMSGKFARALLELSDSNLTQTTLWNRIQDRDVPREANLLICKSSDFEHVTIAQDGTNKLIDLDSSYTTSAQSLDRMVKIVRFLNVKVEEIGRDEVGWPLKTWLDIGRWEGILKELKATIDCPGVDSEKVKVAKLDKLKELLRQNSAFNAWAVYPAGDISMVFVIVDNGYTYQWSPSNAPILISRVCTRQADFSLDNLRPKDLIPVYTGLKVQMPHPLEKLAGRVRPGERPNVLQALRANIDNFRDLRIPLFEYERGWRRGLQYTVNTRGLYGTWDQLGSLIEQSSPQYYQRIVRELANYPNHTVDVFLFFYNENPRHTWNCVVRAINENNQVVWYARRYGDGMGVNWTLRAIDPGQLTNAGEAGEGNYVAPVPRPVRQPRQARNAQAQQAAAPDQANNDQFAAAGNINLQAAQEFRIAAENTARAFATDAEHSSTLLNDLGFAALALALEARPDLGRNVLIYEARQHRGGNTQWVAILYAAGQPTLVAGYPQNHGLAVIQANSQQWRRLTQELDNSTHTFQQCHDICREFHITLPVAIQGWLVYRGVNNG